MLKNTRALLVVDEPNDFSLRTRLEFLEAIRERVSEARREKRPIAWLPNQIALGPKPGFGPERLFESFSDGALFMWLQELSVTTTMIVGFHAHMSVSAVARDALSRGLEVIVDPDAVGARPVENLVLGRQNADEVRASALLHLTAIGVKLEQLPRNAVYLDWLDGRRAERAVKSG